jgi:hypothetical protein
MKVKITTEVDIDLEKFFGVEKSAKKDEITEKDYLITSIYEIIRDAYTEQIEDNCYWMFEQKQFYEDVKHHKLIDIEISKQLLDNLKIE